MTITRREFLKSLGAAAAAMTVSSCTKPFGILDPVGNPDVPESGSMPLRQFGSTSSTVSLIGLGGQRAIEASDSATAIQIVNRAIDLGVNYIDTAANYGTDRSSETHIGQVMATRRHEVFLATKSGAKSYDDVLTSFDESVSRLQTDYVDLYQVHNIGTESDVSALYTKTAGRSAIDAFARLRDEGRARFIGITGHHDPDQLLATLTHPDAPHFDAILLALNAADHHQKPFFGGPLWTEVTRRYMAIVAMKIHGGWYLTPEVPSAADRLNYVLSYPISCAVVGVNSLAQLEENVQVASQFSAPLSPEEMQSIEALTTGTEPDGPWRGDWFKVER